MRIAVVALGKIGLPLAVQFADCLGLAGDTRAAFLQLARAGATVERLDLRAQPAPTGAPYRHTLPAQPTALIGREREVASVGRLLQQTDVHLVTLTGPGGVGKTRLALQVAAELAERFADGVWFVALAASDSSH